MVDTVNAEIIAIGTELLLGELTDTNSVYLAQQCRNLGINIFYMTSVGDNRKRIADAIRLAFSRADVVITCGGLGPTVDDMTRQSIADATDRDLEFQQDLYDQIVARFATFKVTMTDNNSQQAYLPQNAIKIENPVGTAPSFIVEHGDKAVVSLPGVPREMKYLFQNEIIPYLHQRYKLGTIKARTLRTAGIGESTLDDMLGNELLNLSNPTIGLAAHHGIIDIRMTAKADDSDLADQMLDKIETAVREKAGMYIYGTNKDEIETVLHDLFASQNAHIAVLEAGIHDAVIEALMSAHHEDILAYRYHANHPDDVLSDFPESANMTFRERAHYIAQRITQDHNTQAGIAILSLPDVNENPDIDIATVVAVCVGGELKSRVYGFGAQNDLTAKWVSRWAMAYVWRQLKEQLTNAQ
ncbi:MAG: molybdopterin-binding protein [Chloroflexota bacterium]